jgi:uncharacterized protein (UPF0548 family)
MFLGHRPSSREIDAFVETSRRLPLSYEPIGLAEQTPAGYTTDHQEAVVGRGDGAFERAKVALTAWRHFDLGWVELFPPHAQIQPGTVVAVVVRHLGFWSMNGCRIVYLIDADREYGFAYGTLPNHAESGEEIFTVSLNPETGDVTYVIRAVSRPRALLARLGYPVTRRLQARFRRDSSAAMSRAIAG